MKNLTRDYVHYMLMTFPETRNSDILLVSKVWERHLQLNPWIKATDYPRLLKDCFPDTITRIRRALQREGLYPASEVIQKSRTKLEMDMKLKGPKLGIK